MSYSPSWKFSYILCCSAQVTAAILHSAILKCHLSLFKSTSRCSKHQSLSPISLQNILSHQVSFSWLCMNSPKPTSSVMIGMGMLAIIPVNVCFWGYKAAVHPSLQYCKLWELHLLLLCFLCRRQEMSGLKKDSHKIFHTQTAPQV